MSADRNFSAGPATVTVVLVDGRSHVGQLPRFSPGAVDLALTTPSGRVSFPTERVAYVGFHRPQGGPPSPPSARRGALKVHISSGVALVVDPDPDPPGPLGFYAKPAESQSAFKEIFFYNHGIKLRELNEPLGEMLLRDGRVGAGALERGSRRRKARSARPSGRSWSSTSVSTAARLNKPRSCRSAKARAWARS